MNEEEIKEILEEFLKEKGAYSLRYSFNGDLAYSQEQILKNYIINMQKANERLKEENSNLIAKNKRKLAKYVNFPMSRFRGTAYIKEKIKCPQLGSICYGEWGALPLEVRYTLYDLCELIDSRDKELEELRRFRYTIRKDETKTPPIITRTYKREYEEAQQRIDKAIEYIKENGYIDLNGYDLLEILGGDE